MGRHVWAPIAPETGDEPRAIWKWCIRCGALKLGNTIFEHGPHQGTTLISVAGVGGMKKVKEAKVCLFKKPEQIPDDIQERCDKGSDQDLEALDEQVHSMMSVEASGINNTGMEGQVRWLHDSAGMPWSEIRGLIDLKEKKA